MKSIRAHIYSSTDHQLKLKELENILLRKPLTELDKLKLQNISDCIKEYVSRTRLVSPTGTIISLSQNFELSTTNVVIVLEIPEKTDIFTRLIRRLRGDI